ncbi:MAG TPA: M43 family zinc metalloprotease [Flavihumibacter sp.]
MRRILVLFISLFVPAWLFAQKECSQESYQSFASQANNPANLLTNSTGITTLGSTNSAVMIGSANPVANSSNNPVVPLAAQNPPAGEIVIPVVVHIVQSANVSVSDAQVHSQIEALNRDFQAKNADLIRVPDRFKHLVANCELRFELAKVNPAGEPTTGIVRVNSKVAMFGMDDRIKFSSKGGSDAWPAAHYLNIWVGNMVNGISGYSTVPGSKPSVDGVVINHTAFGSSNKKGKNTLGRIAVHEVGHWLGLKHIWGDAYCGDDGIDDTPQQKTYNRGCPSGIQITCGNDPNGDMYMNYMDLTDDSCMYMFTLGQKVKMRSSFAPGGGRETILEGLALQTDGEIIDPHWGKPNKSAVTPKALGVYPVPAQKELRVEIPDYNVLNQKTLMVYNMTGQPIMQVPIRSSQVFIDISNLKTGQYLIKTDRADQPVARFVKL